MTTDTHKSDTPPPLIPKTTEAAWLMGPAFLLVAIGFVVFGSTPDLPVASTPDFSPTLLTMTTRSAIIKDPPMTHIGAFTYSCNDCHRIIDAGEERGDDKVQHLDITLNHGINNHCYNCHDKEDRDKLSDRNGNHISYTDVPMLCAQCHGPTYRDWERGMHGKTLGSWQTDSHDQERLSCSQCHDPHSPAFHDFQPLPGPNTIRMGDKPAELHDERKGPLAIPFQHNESNHSSEGGADH